MKKFVVIYSKLMTGLYSLIRILVAVSLVIMVAVTSIEVVRRYIYGLSFIWSEELVRFLLIITTFAGGAAAYRSKSLARLDLITTKLPTRINDILDFIITLGIIVLCAYLSVRGYQYSFSPQIAMMKSTGLKLKMTYVYLAIPIGFNFLILFAFERLLILITGQEASGKERK